MIVHELILFKNCFMDCLNLNSKLKNLKYLLLLVSFTRHSSIFSPFKLRMKGQLKL